MAKKRFFTKNNERVGKKSGKPRGKYKKRDQGVGISSTEVISIISSKPQFPNIPQNITEKLPKITFSLKLALFAVFGLVVLSLSVWQIVGVVGKSVVLSRVVSQRSKLVGEMQLWDNIAQKYPGYRDAYFQAAVLAYRLGDGVKEKAYLNKTFQIDPNYQPARSLVQLSE